MKFKQNSLSCSYPLPANRRFLRCLLAVLLLIASVAVSRAQTVPVATASASRQLVASFANPVIGHMATNSNGDLFYVNSAYSGAAVLYRLPRGTTTPVQIATGFSGARNVFVDSANNVYVPNAYSGNIIEFPYTNGTYVTNFTVASSIAACGSYTPTAPCAQFGSVGAVGGYYYQPVDLGLDAQGNAYILNAYANGSCAGNCILKFAKNDATSGNYTPSVIRSNVTPQDYGAQLAVDPAGDVFYEQGGSRLYVFAAGTTAPVSFGTGITSVAGVATDAYGNLYVTNSASPYAIYEFPAVRGAVSTSTQFSVLGTYSGGGPAVDALGDLYYLGYSGGNTLNVAQLNSIALGSAVPSTPVATSAISVTFTFGAAATVGSISSSGAAFAYATGSCAAGSYRAGDTCTVNVNYTPTAVGLQRGAVVLNSSAGTPVATALLSGVGTGALQTNDPGTVSALGSGLTSPRGVAVGPSNDVYVVDAGQNAVLRYAGGTGTPATVGTGLKNPTAVAVDNAGNVYIADAGNSRVVMVPVVNGAPSNSAQTTVYSGSSTGLSGVTLDFAGNLYIADSGAKSVTELLNIGGTPRVANALSLGTLTGPAAVATDNNGNLFVADGNAVVRINYVGRAQSVVSSAFSKPTALALDASGSLYVADNGNARLVKVPFEGTAYNTNDQYLVGATVATPYGVALDSSANLYVTDNAAASAVVLNRSAGTLPLGRVQIPQTSASQNATIGNAGTSALTFGTPLYAAVSTTPAYFSVSPTGTNGCAAGATLATGFACSLSATITPTTTGSFSDVLTFSSNALNTPKTLTITGTAVNLQANTITLTASPATVTFGTPVTIQAAITSSGVGTPTGTVSFTVDGNSQGRGVALSGSGTASITLSGLTGGTRQVCGNYTGDDNFRPTNTCITVTVAKLATSTSLSITTTGSAPVTGSVGDTATLTATIASTGGTPPTGTVTFATGSQVLGTVPVSLGGATLATTALPAGTLTITATYSGDVNYVTSNASAVDIVTYPTVIVSPGTSNLTVGKVDAGTLTLSVTSLGGFTGAVALSCQGLPANTVCSFSPNSFTVRPNTPQTVTLQVLTGQTPVVAQPVTGALIFRSLGGRLGMVACVLLAPFGFAARRHVVNQLGRAVLTLLIVAGMGAVATTLTGCGSTFFGNTPTGSSNVTITANATVSGTYGYGTSYAPGCAATKTGSTTVTCAETAALNLTVR